MRLCVSVRTEPLRVGQRCNYTACQHRACGGRCTGVVWVRVKSPVCVCVFLCFLPFPGRYGHGFEMFCLASDGGSSAAATVVASACKVGGAKNSSRLIHLLCGILFYFFHYLLIFFSLRSASPGVQSRARGRAAVERCHLEAAAGTALPRPHCHPDGLLPGWSPPAGRVS